MSFFAKLKNLHSFGKKLTAGVHTFGHKVGNVAYKVGDRLKQNESFAGVGNFINKHIGNTAHDIAKSAGNLHEGHLIEAGHSIHFRKNASAVLNTARNALMSHDANIQHHAMRNHESLQHLPNFV